MEFFQVPFLFVTTFTVVIASIAAVWMTFSRRKLSPPGLGKLTFAIGWLLLALAETLHGASLVNNELDQNALVLRAASYALLVFSLLSARAGAGGAGALVVTQTAFLPSFLAAAGAWVAQRSKLGDARRLALCFVFLGASEFVFAIGGAGSTQEATALWIGARLLRLAAAIALASWLWEGFRTSIQLRIVAVLVVLSLIVVVLISSAMTQVFATSVRAQALADAVRDGEAQKLIMNEQRREAVQDARQVAGAEAVQRAVTTRAPSLSQLAAGLEGPGNLFESADFLAFFAPVETGAGILAYSAQGPTGAPPNLSDIDATALAGTDVVTSAIRGDQASSVDLIGEDKIALIAAFPILQPPGFAAPGSPVGIAGAVALGNIVDSNYLETLSSRSGRELSLLSQEGVIASTLPGSDRLIREDLPKVFEDRKTITGEARFGGIEYFSAYVPLERADGRIVAALVVSSRSEVIALTQQSVGRVLFVLVLIAALVAVVLSYLSGGRVTRPIIELTRASDRVRRGDLRSRVEIQTGDEIGVLGETFNEMTASMARLTGDLRRVAQEEFELRTRLETIVQSMTDGLIAIDPEGRVVTLNREAERILGVRATRSRGRHIREVLTLNDTAGRKLELPIYSLKRGTIDSAYTAPRDNGSRLPVAITSAPIEDDEGSVVGGVALIRDLTSQIEVERMKTEFLSNISHELRTPLTPIKGYTDLMRRKPVPRKQAIGFLDNMASSIGRLERIVDMLVDVSSMEAGRLTPRTVPVDLDKATLALVDRWRGAAPKHRFSRRGFSNLPTMKLDERLVPRAIDELIDNAVKFSPKGGKVVLTGELQKSQNGRIARISVVDEGMGLTDEQLSEILNDFVQGDASATRQYGGLGIGLSYVRRIAEAHGGTVEVENLENKGSRFSILLPVSDAATLAAEDGAAAKKKVPMRQETTESARMKPTSKKKTTRSGGKRVTKSKATRGAKR
jgi:PAS domain S-box-containing protein